MFEGIMKFQRRSSSSETRNSGATHGNSSSSSMKSAVLLMGTVFIGIVLITLLFSPRHDSIDVGQEQSSNPQEYQHEHHNDLISAVSDENSISKTVIEKLDDGVIVADTVLDVSYYYCSKNSRSDTSRVTFDIVLLHGSAFTKENWRDSNIMQMLCSNDGNMKHHQQQNHHDHQDVAVRVVALDLPVTARHKELRDVLDELHNQQRIHLPVSAIVTPSASGSTMIDWFMSGYENSHELQTKYVKSWIPVASTALLKIPKEEVRQRIGEWSVLAIYGDQDSAGKRSSQVLGQNVANSTIVELNGRHPCYLDSPKEFVHTVLDYIVTLNNTRSY